MEGTPGCSHLQDSLVKEAEHNFPGGWGGEKQEEIFPKEGVTNQTGQGDRDHLRMNQEVSITVAWTK